MCYPCVLRITKEAAGPDEYKVFQLYRVMKIGDAITNTFYQQILGKLLSLTVIGRPWASLP